MVAERAVQQQIDDLRGELGIKFNQLENGEGGLKALGLKLGELEEELSNLNTSVTDAFKNNNALLRSEIQAMKGDLSQ